jgi:N-acetylglucosamine kinase-like BadF-type ATPase
MVWVELVKKMSSLQLILGVDGGGSKTTAWLAECVNASAVEAGIRVVGQGNAGPGNPHAVGFEAAMYSIRAATANAFRAFGRKEETVAAACIGIAGGGNSEVQKRVRELLQGQTQMAELVQVTTDPHLVVAAANGSLPTSQLDSMKGIALISGTGSIAWGRAEDGREARSGGWGYLLGDEGSGYWIGRAGLQAACRAADGRGPSTLLLEAFRERFQLGQPLDLIGKVYQPSFGRREIAELAPLVLELSSEDPSAGEILEEAANDLSTMVVAVARLLDCSLSQLPLAMAGGLLTNHAMLRDRVDQGLQKLGLMSSSSVLIPQPVVGALHLAASVAINCKLLAKTPPMSQSISRGSTSTIN